MLRAHMRDMQAAIAAAGKQQRGLPWDDDAPAGLSGAHDVTARLERATQLMRALDEWMREAQEAQQQLRHAIALRTPSPHE